MICRCGLLLFVVGCFGLVFFIGIVVWVIVCGCVVGLW